MALDHSRLDLENEFLENKSGPFFCVRQVYLTKSCQQIWVRVNQHFVLFIHHIWGETVIWGAVFIIQISDKMQYFTIFQEKLHSFNIQNHRSTRGLLAKLFRKFPKSGYSASRFSLLTSAKFSVNIKRVTLRSYWLGYMSTNKLTALGLVATVAVSQWPNNLCQCRYH